MCARRIDVRGAPPAGPEPLFASQVVALADDELWVVADVGKLPEDPYDAERQVVLTTRIVGAPLMLRPPATPIDDPPT